MNGLETLTILGNYLVSLLVEAGHINHAQSVLNRLSEPDEYSWNSLLIGYLKNHEPKNAFAVHKRMEDLGTMNVSDPAFVLLLKACAEDYDFGKGYELHNISTRLGLVESNVFIGSTMIDMYSKFGLLMEAKQVFISMSAHDVVSWTALIAGYVEHKCWMEALDCFQKMQQECVSPNGATYACVLRACCSIRDIARGRELHAEAGRWGMLESHSSIGSALIDMYMKCGLLNCAQEVFDSLLSNDVVSWTVLISGYVENGFDYKALHLIEQMRAEGVFYNAFTVVCGLRVCCNLLFGNKVQQLHMEAERQGLFEDNPLVCGTLMNAYAKCGLMDKGRQAFDKFPVRNSNIWTTLILGYAENGLFEEVCDLLNHMELEGCSPDPLALVCCLNACQTIGNTDEVGELLRKVEHLGLIETNINVESTLIHMHLKSGSVTLALQLFDKLAERDVVVWTILISGVLECGLSEQASQYVEQIQQEGVLSNVDSHILELKISAMRKSIKRGQQIHAKLEVQGLVEGCCAVGNSLIDMYTKFGCMALAEQVFERLPDRDVVSWTTLISGYVDNEDNEQGLSCIKNLSLIGLIPNTITLFCGLKACISIGALNDGQDLHAEIERRELLDCDLMLGNNLIEFYAKFGWHLKGRELLQRLPFRDVGSWNAMIAGCAESGHFEIMFECFNEMQLEGICPNELTLLCCLKACSISEHIEKGEAFYIEMERLGIAKSDPFLGSALVDMYCKCGSLVKAQEVFHHLIAPDVVSWTALTAGYVAYGLNVEALYCFERMQIEGVIPNILTSDSSLKACGAMRALRKGQEIHVKVNSLDSLDRAFICYTLLQMYVDCNCLTKARQVFDMLPVQDRLSWEVLISGYMETMTIDDTLEKYKTGQCQYGSSDVTTLIFNLVEFMVAGNTEKAQYIHSEIERQGMVENNPVLGNVILDLYSRCGMVDKAQLVFDKLLSRDVGSWSSLLTGYADNGHFEKAIMCYEQMQEENIHPDYVSFMLVLKSCISVGDINRVRKLLAMVGIDSLSDSEMLAGSTLIDLCVKCGSTGIAQEIFDILPFRRSTIWTAVIVWYMESGHTEEAINCFEQMQDDKILPTAAALVCLLKACGTLGAIDKGRHLHNEVEIRGLLDRDTVGNSLLSMYMRCGSLIDAQQLFRQLPSRDVVSWTILMTGYGILGKFEDVFHTFDEMVGLAIQPDAVCFLVILNVCSRTGLFVKSEMYLEAMSRLHGIIPSVKHYTSIVHILCRVGHLDAAIAKMSMIPVAPNFITWQNVLGVCMGAGNMQLAKQAFKQVLYLGENRAGTGRFSQT
ncbi:hypothetical protein KP509_26G023300 [Ceratopteris richardii]|nr:hypothetical protein KP509_26G023300 [Ceratopteris richardii]